MKVPERAVVVDVTFAAFDRAAPVSSSAAAVLLAGWNLVVAELAEIVVIDGAVIGVMDVAAVRLSEVEVAAAVAVVAAVGGGVSVAVRLAVLATGQGSSLESLENQAAAFAEQ